MTDDTEVTGVSNKAVEEELQAEAVEAKDVEAKESESKQRDSQTNEQREEGRGRPASTTYLAKRRALLLMLREFWPNITRAVVMAGLNYDHYRLYLADPEFCRDLELIKQSKLDRVEGFMADMALTPKGFMDRIAMLRAHRPERWDKEKQVVVSHRMERAQVEAKHANISHLLAIDADIIEATTGKVHQIPAPQDLISDAPTLISDLADGAPEVEKTPGQGTPENNLDSLVSSSDEVGGLDLPEESGYTSGVIEILDAPDAKISARPKKPTRKTSEQTLPPLPLSKSKKAKRS